MRDQSKKGRKALRAGVSVRLATVSPALLVLLIGIGVGDLLIFAVSTNLALNGSIIGLTVLAAGMAYMRAADIDLDRREIYRIARDRDGEYGQEPGFKLHGPLAHAFAMIQRSAANDGHRGFQSAVDRETDLLRGSFSQRLAVLQYMTGLLISLGLLGTFLGLLRTLVASSEVLDAVGIGAGSLESGDATEMFSAMILSLKAPLTNMGTAFSSSLFGLVGSITVGVMVLILQRTANTNIAGFRNLMLSSRDWLFSFKQEESVDAAIVQDILTAMLERERLAQRRSDQVLAVIRDGMEGLSEASERIDGIAAAVERLAGNLSDLPAWCAENHDIVAQLRSSGAELSRLAERAVGIETGLTRLEANGKGALDSLAAVQGQMMEQAKHNKSVETLLNTSAARLDELAGQAEALTGALAHHASTAEAVASSVRGIADQLEPMREQSGRLTDTVSSLLGATDRMMVQGQKAWSSLEENLATARVAQADQLMSMSQTAGLLDRMNGLLTAALDHLTEMSAALPMQQGQMERLEQRLEPLSSIDAVVHEQLSTVLQLVGRIGHIESLYETSRSSLWELIAGQTSQVQLMTSMLDAQRAQSERESAFSLTVERHLESMLRFEAALERLPKASLLVEQSNAAASRLLAISEQIGGLAQVQNELRTEASRATGLMQSVVMESRSQETQRIEAFRQIYISLAKLADLMESRLNDERFQDRGFSDARGATGEPQDRQTSGGKPPFRGADPALGDLDTDMMTGSSPEGADGGLRKGIRRIAQSLKLRKGDD